MIDLDRIRDRIAQWWRYPQPSIFRTWASGQYTDVIDTEFTAIRLASEESAKYVLSHMRTVPNFSCDYDLHKWVATTQVDTKLLLNGVILEFGVASGRTINHFARLFPNRLIHGFDSFEGLPEDWTSRMPAGFFKRAKLPDTETNVKLWVGWFDETLPTFKNMYQSDPIALLHIDCDLYSSTCTVLDALRERLRPGTVIIFDEYMNYPGWQQDEYRAWQKFVTENKMKYEYIGRVSRHQQVAVRITDVG